jgi:peptidoglycan/LPS O-acetylase OafA/YrhL
LPPYWFYTTLVLIVSLGAPAVVNSSFAHPPSLWRSYLLIPDTVDPLLAVGWTLIHEMYFYLCFALMIFLIRSRGFTLPFLLLTWMLAVAGLHAVLKLNDIADPVAAVVAHPLTLEFVFGATIGVLIRKKIAAFAAPALAAGIAALLVIVLRFPDTAAGLIADRNWMRPILIGAPCALVVYAAVAMEIRGALHAPRWLTILGDVSYSTYLSHVLVLSALGRLFAMVPNHTVYLEAALVVVGVVTANAVGWLSWRLIERPAGIGIGKTFMVSSGTAG